MKTRRLGLFALFCTLLLAFVILAVPGHTRELSGVSLPMALKGYLPFPLSLNSAWTTDASATPTTEFTGGETMQYHGSGTNSSDGTIAVDRSWTVNNYCGETLLYTDTVSLDPGDWTTAITQTTPACSGISNYSLQVTFDERPTEITTTFTVTNPVTPEVWALPAFDACDNPSVSDMQEWWYKSPYWSVNVYIGGVARLCDNLDLTPEWVRAVMDQGWALIPTWVGPQAPCSRFLYKFSYDPVEAYEQGRAEADAAALEAARLGLTSFGSGSTIIYYDLEGYSSPDKLPECRAASKSFVNGWVERMHELGSLAGMYGGSCSSYMSDWATIANVPDDVWIAWWTEDEYTPDVSVWDIICLSNTLWSNNQRLRQYAGDHSETWGSVTMPDIDSDVTLGQVLALVPTPEPTEQARLERSMSVSGPSVESLGALSVQQAWVVLEGQLFWTEDGGINWSERGPDQGSIQAATFLDQEHGWLVTAASATQPGLAIWRTIDGGQSWQDAPLTAASEWLLSARAVSLDFINPMEGWLSIKLASSANFNLGVLLHTSDGGLTWEKLNLPGGEAIDFISETHGWTLAGPLGDELYQTQDGGISWQPAGSTASAPQDFRNPLPSNLPGAAGIRYVDPDTAWAFTRRGECDSLSCITRSGIWRTLDGGITWDSVALPASP